MTFRPLVTSGPTADRPVAPEIGTAYFDTDVDKTLYWSGADWVDAAGAADQTITVEFTGATDDYDPNAVAPKALNVPIRVMTSDGQPTTQEITVTVNRTGGTAVDPDDYTDESPYSVVIPIGSAHDSTDEFLTVAVVTPNAGIPPAKTIILTLTDAPNAVIGAESVFTITLDTP